MQRTRKCCCAHQPVVTTRFRTSVAQEADEIRPSATSPANSTSLKHLPYTQMLTLKSNAPALWPLLPPISWKPRRGDVKMTRDTTAILQILPTVNRFTDAPTPRHFGTMTVADLCDLAEEHSYNSNSNHREETFSDTRGSKPRRNPT